jgi:hypothetical protein
MVGPGDGGPDPDGSGDDDVVDCDGVDDASWAGGAVLGERRFLDLLCWEASR